MKSKTLYSDRYPAYTQIGFFIDKYALIIIILKTIEKAIGFLSKREVHFSFFFPFPCSLLPNT